MFVGLGVGLSVVGTGVGLWVVALLQIQAPRAKWLELTCDFENSVRSPVLRSTNVTKQTAGFPGKAFPLAPGSLVMERNSEALTHVGMS